MNNYIPLNKAVGPVCIYDGSEPLIDKKLGVEATECRFDGSECEHASCSGAPEMFIKVEEDGLYYFGLEADDKGFLKIAGGAPKKPVLLMKNTTASSGRNHTSFIGNI